MQLEKVYLLILKIKVKMQLIELEIQIIIIGETHLKVKIMMNEMQIAQHLVI
jgi:hypothetical protein